MAAYTRPRHEEQVRKYCEQQKIEVFLPSYQIWRNWSDRRKWVQMPLFPSYVFVDVDEAERRRTMHAPGFLWYVRTSKGPVRVDESELQGIRQLLASGLEFDPLPQFALGDEVEIAAGALRGCRGRLLRKDRGDIALNVSAVGCSVRVRIPDPRWLRSVAPGSSNR